MENSPLVLDILKATLDNPYYRRVINTTKDMQLVLMKISPGEDIPMEIHKGTQFVRVESGSGIVIIDEKVYPLRDDISVMIPGGHPHYFRASDTEALKLYSLYSPPEHPVNQIDINQP